MRNSIELKLKQRIENARQNINNEMVTNKQTINKNAIVGVIQMYTHTQQPSQNWKWESIMQRRFWIESKVIISLLSVSKTVLFRSISVFSDLLFLTVIRTLVHSASQPVSQPVLCIWIAFFGFYYLKCSDTLCFHLKISNDSNKNNNKQTNKIEPQPAKHELGVNIEINAMIFVLKLYCIQLEMCIHTRLNLHIVICIHFIRFVFVHCTYMFLHVFDVWQIRGGKNENEVIYKRFWLFSTMPLHTA